MDSNGKREQDGRRAHRGHYWIPLLTAILALPGAAIAQQNDHDHDGLPGHPRGEFFLYGEGSVSAGGLHSYAGLGGSVGAGGLIFLNHHRNAALRVEGRLTAFDGRFNHPPVHDAGLRNLRVGTEVAIFSAGIGPQVYLMTGAVRPYIFGTLGFSRLVGDMYVRGRLGGELLERSVNLDGVGAALSAGGGVSVRVRSGDHPVSLDVSASYQTNGTADHLDRRHTAGRRGEPDPARIPGDYGGRAATDHHHGSQAAGDHHYGDQIVFPHLVSGFDFVTWRIGVTFGVF